ncbi:MAG TPA: putative Ig domain-containing protein, partial [Verrucomicrobiae bacterium]|nr:putative Ig domain-containing protein [Verrucomicrobiae bacterium]
IPSLSSTQAFSVIVREVNSAPFFINVVPDVQVDEETSFNYTVEASDSDIPLNSLTWQLGPNAPIGMSINPANGTLSWLPGESRGPGEYPLTITVRDNGSPQLSATRSLRVIVREVNRAPNLDPIPTQVTLVESTLTVSASATDPDVPAQQFFFSLAPGAPRGARIDAASGVFTWTPTRSFAMTTNPVTVRVTDNGVPSLSAEQTFSIIVGDLLEARLGAGVVLSGGSNTVPITIYTTTPATNVTFDFEMHVNRLANFSLDPPAAPLSSATLQPLGGNRYRVQLGAAASQHFAGEQIVSHLRFTALSGLPSTFVPLEVLTVTARQTDGEPVPRALGSDGRVVYLGNEPLLEILPRQDHLDLTLYGIPAPSYTIESKTSLVPTVNWAQYWQGPSSNLSEVFSVPPTNQMRYFRARRP